MVGQILHRNMGTLRERSNTSSYLEMSNNNQKNKFKFGSESVEPRVRSALSCKLSIGKLCLYPLDKYDD